MSIMLKQCKKKYKYNQHPCLSISFGKSCVLMHFEQKKQNYRVFFTGKTLYF